MHNDTIYMACPMKYSVKYLTPLGHLHVKSWICCPYASLENNVEFLIFLFLVIEEKGVRLRLTITDTPGFGDQVNNTNW